MLSVRGLTTRQQGLQVSNIDITVKRGDVVAIVGPNGSGKSTILERIANPSLSYGGEISLNHFSSRENIDKYKVQIGYLPQNIQLPLHLTGFEFAQIVGSLYYLDAAKRSERIAQLNKQYRVDLYTTLESVSPAERQKVGLIASLIAEPPLLIWDEPTLFLDPASATATVTLLQEHVENGGAALLASNNLSLVEDLASYIIVIDNGQVVAEGSVQQLLNHAGNAKNLAAAYARLLAA